MKQVEYINRRIKKNKYVGAFSFREKNRNVENIFKMAIFSIQTIFLSTYKISRNILFANN